MNKSLWVAALLLAAGAAQAQATDTLKKIKDSGAVTKGVRESSGALSYTLGDGKYVGFHVELCQHALEDIPRFLHAASAAPGAVICGRPIFDDSMPPVRRVFRHLTHALVWVHTLSFDIRDSMCGYRMYPLAPTVAMLDAEPPGLHMDFDIEVLVRLHWRGVPMRWVDTRVTYPADGVSHFRLLRDNARISGLHARLFLGMLWRAPRLLARRLRRAPGVAHA